MCGISGIVGEYFVNRKNKISNILSHRGPDNRGDWINHNSTVYFNHNRLSIIDLNKSANQPMYDDSGRYVLDEKQI